MAEAVESGFLAGRKRREGSHQAVLASAGMLFWLAFFGVLFPDAARGALRVWLVSPTFNHCFLVVPLSVFLVWHRRAQLLRMMPAPDLRAAAAILLLGLAWIVAFICGVLEAQQFIVLTMIQAALFGTFGAAWYRKLAAPFLYLYFLVPSGSYLIPSLQAFTARFAVVGLHLLGIPVFSDGSVIEIPAGTFAVAEACAGLRFLIAAIAFGVFFAVMTYRSRARRLAFVALSVVVPIIANGFRALGLIAAAEWLGSPSAALADHIIYGWIFFSLVLLLLIAAGQFFSDHADESGIAPHSGEVPANRSFPVSRSAAVCAACIFAAAAGPVAASLMPAMKTPVLPDAPPGVAMPWKEAGGRSDWSPVFAVPSRVFSQGFMDGPHRVDRLIAIYAAQGQNSGAFGSTDRDADERTWSFDSEGSGTLNVRGQAIPVRESSWLRGSTKRLVWSFYVVDGRVAPTALMAKWNALRGYLTGSRCVSAYVALSIESADQDAARTTVERFLAASRPLDSYLCAATRAPR